MRRPWYKLFFYSLVGIILLFTQGCGDTNLFESMSDDDSEAARLEEMKQDLNSGDFDRVIAYLGAKPQETLTEKERRYLSSAYVGKAGFDTLTMLDKIAEAEEADEDVETFDIIGTIFNDKEAGATDEGIEEGALDTKVDYINKAIKVLDPNSPDQARLKTSWVSNDIIVQRGIYSALHVVLNICLTIYQRYKVDKGLSYVPLTIKHLEKHFNHGEINLPSDLPLGRLNHDLSLLAQAVDVLGNGSMDGDIAQDPIDDGGENDLEREFNQFLREIGYLPGGEVTSGELSVYLNNLLD